MGLDRIIKLTFTEPLEKNNIKNIVDNAIALQCIFYNHPEEEKFCCSLLSPVEITEHFYQKNGNSQGGCLFVYNDSSYFTFSIYQIDKHKASLQIFLEVDYWIHPNFEYTCDYERYLRLLLKITHGIPLQAIAIEYET